MTNPMDTIRRASGALGLTFAAYALLVALNLGEFWPFSIYPMFSQGGIPWSRAVVREVDSDVAHWLRTEAAGRHSGSDDVGSPEALAGYADNFWRAREADELPGEAFPLNAHGADPIDLANFVSKTRTWDEARVLALREIFGQSTLDETNLVVLRVDGRLAGEDSVGVTFTPYALMTADTSIMHPNLPREVQ